jgi:hypothetical protein
VTIEQDFEIVRDDLRHITDLQESEAALARIEAELNATHVPSWTDYDHVVDMMDEAKRQRDALKAALGDARRVVIKYHEWLEKHEKLNTDSDDRRTGYIGLDHAVGENIKGCSGCATARQALEVEASS